MFTQIKSRGVYLIIVLLLLLATPAHANEDVLHAQLTALSSYLTRMYGVPSTPLTEVELRSSIYAGAEWLKNTQESTGHFRYEYLPYEGTYRNDDNIVRQAGALYALGEIVRRSDGDTAAIEKTMERSIGYFENISEESEVGGTAFRCIPRTPSTSRCPLGATSLALIGILSYVEHTPSEESRYTRLIKDYLTYILSVQKENGGFQNTHVIGRSSQSDEESAFSNGEALLALVRYYAYKPDREVKQVIDAAFLHLKAQPYDANLYLWMMAALKDMHTLWPNETYITYAKDFTNWRLARARLINQTDRNYCPYAEGLASALTLLEKSLTAGERNILRNELDLRNQKHYALQLTLQDAYRLLPTKEGLLLKKLVSPDRAIGGFLTQDSEPTLRIDFTQHCITTYAQTLVDLEEKEL